MASGESVYLRDDPGPWIETTRTNYADLLGVRWPGTALLYSQLRGPL